MATDAPVENAPIDPGMYSSSTNTTTAAISITAIAILTSVVVFLSVLLFFFVTAYIQNRLEQRRNRFLVGSESNGQDDDGILQERIDRRYETIEHWLITKRVLKYDQFCDRVVKGIIPQSPPCDESMKDLEAAASTPTVLKHLETMDTVECEEDSLFHDDIECPICMAALQEGDVVSWSANESCKHVFHHECIKEWLVRRTGCPFCREIFLLCDEIHGVKSTEELKEMSKQYAARSSTMFYTLQGGLITLPTTVRCTLKELDELKARIFDSTLKAQELTSIRGERREVTTSSHSKDDIEIGVATASDGVVDNEISQEESTPRINLVSPSSSSPSNVLLEEVSCEDGERTRETNASCTTSELARRNDHELQELDEKLEVSLGTAGDNA